MRRTDSGKARRSRARGGLVLAAAALMAGAALPSHAEPRGDGLVQVDLGLDGAQPDNWSEARGLSADGRYAVFTSMASNLVQGDTNRLYDVFVRDLRAGRTERVSLADDGTQLNGSTSQAAISGDGRYVAFASDAADVLPGLPANGGYRVFVRDRRTGHTEPVSVDGNATSPTISADGRYVAYVLDGRDIHVTDRRKGTTRPVTAGADGSRADDGSADPVISADGAAIGFRSRATNLLPRDRAATASRPPRPRPTFPFYVYDARTGRIQGASVDPAGVPRDAHPYAGLSPDGRYALFRAFEANGTDEEGSHVELYVRDLWHGTTTKAALPLPGTRTVHDAYRGSVTADGRWLLFASGADNLVPGDTDQSVNIFRRDLRTGRIDRISAAGGGADISWSPNSLSVDGPGATALFDGGGKVYARRLPPA
ncbi:hypothetical protein ACQEVS_32800 [Streptomyces sp. CA-181903]|uniref:hypothetical protein n=1 Tax=Streptomyces sp. CA-181903 TaxID=3240055 RepID=UPI003D924BA4